MSEAIDRLARLRPDESCLAELRQGAATMVANVAPQRELVRTLLDLSGRRTALVRQVAAAHETLSTTMAPLLERGQAELQRSGAALTGDTRTAVGAVTGALAAYLAHTFTMRALLTDAGSLLRQVLGSPTAGRVELLRQSFSQAIDRIKAGIEGLRLEGREPSFRAALEQLEAFVRPRPGAFQLPTFLACSARR